MNALTPIADRLANEGVNYAPQIVNAAAKNGIDPELLAAVAAQETGGPGANGGRNIIGDGGHGHGLFQIDDRSHTFASSAAAMDPEQNADYAAGMLSGLIKRFGGNVRAALSAYNSGSPTAPGTQTTWGDGQTLDYADSVIRHYRDLAGNAPATPQLAFNRPSPHLPIPHHHHGRLGHWRAVVGTDATGHRASGGMSVDTYVNGGSSSS